MNSFHGVYEIELSNTKAFYIDGSEKILVDTGLKPLHNDVLDYLTKNGYNFGVGGFELLKKGSHHTILNFLKKNRFKVDVIVCTHCHGDHTGNLAQLKEELKVPVAAHSADIPFIEGKEKISNPQFVPEELLKHFEITPCKVDISLKDDEFFNEDLRIIHIEGHTKGSICLLYRDSVLIVGDTILGKNLLNPKMAPDELNLPAQWSCSDYKTALDNLPKLLNYSFNVILPSHGVSIKKDGKRRLEQLIQQTVQK